MKFLIALGSISFLVACPKPATQESSTARLGKMEKLGLLMKNDINPPFSKLTFLVFHGDDMEQDRASLRAELEASAATLRGAIGRLRAWSNVPADSNQGRDVFYTYANSVDKSVERLVGAIARDDKQVVASELEKISNTCNSCHHFFRLDIEDSVVPSTTADVGRDQPLASWTPIP